MSKAAFVLCRDHLDMHIEELTDFGMGANEMLDHVRLYPTIISTAIMQHFHQEVRSAGLRGNHMHVLLSFGVDWADRELYKLLHRKLT